MSEIKNYDPYNYPILSRKDLMMLSTITPNDEKFRKFKGGSSPKKFGILNNKIDYINKNDDIERSNSKLLHPQLNKPDYNLCNNDIPNSSPKSNEFRTNRIGGNPLEPKYNLPKVEILPHTETKFIRDNINIDDIEGTKPKKYIVWRIRDKMDCTDIEGTKKKKTKIRQTYYSNINYEDVTHNKFKTSRHTDPNEPVYEVKYKNGESYVYGKIEKSKPQTNYPFFHPDPLNMKISDIEGAQFGSRNKISKFQSLYSGMHITDLPDARSSSLKKGIVTQRNTNPLDPNYVLPGSKQIIIPENNPYAKTTFDIKSKLDARGQKNNTKEKIEVISKSNFVEKCNHDNKIEHTMLNNNESSRLNTENNVNNVNDFSKDINHVIYCNTDGNIDNTEPLYHKPDPFYGFIHDKYVVPNEKDIKKDKRTNTNGFQKNDKKTIATNKKSKLGQTNSNLKKTFAQKLDSFIN